MHDQTTNAVADSEKPARTAPSGVTALAIMRRIEETIETETASIRTNPAFDLRTSNARKSRHLYELNKAFKNLGEAQFATEHRDALTRLREKLVENEATIRAHMSAVSELAGLLQDAIESTQADGTYSMREFPRVPKK